MEMLIWEQEILWRAAYRVACMHNTREGGLQESLTGVLSRRCELSVQLPTELCNFRKSLALSSWYYL